jgi:hypothetical protein
LPKRLKKAYRLWYVQCSALVGTSPEEPRPWDRILGYQRIWRPTPQLRRRWSAIVISFKIYANL